MKNSKQQSGPAGYIKEGRSYQFLLASLLLVLLVVTTYRGSSDHDFVDWDDYYYVVNNDLVRNPGEHYLKDLFTTPVSLNYHPVTIMSLRLNNNECKSCINGISPKPFIRGNITLHIFNSLLVFILVLLLTNRNLIASFLVAALFGVHPMHVESVAWIAERKDVLYTFFFLSGLIAYINFKKENRHKYLWLVFSFVLFILSCLSKATAVVFPVIAILINFWFVYAEDKSVRRTIKDAISPKNLLLLTPFFIMSFFIGLMALRIQNGENFMGMLNPGKSTSDVVNTVQPFSVLQRFQVAGYGFMQYIIKFLVPVNLYTFYPYPDIREFSQGSFAAALWLSLASTILITFLTIWSITKSKLFAFGIGFYFITIALVLQFISVGIAIMADRYTYLPYLGLSLIPAVLISKSSGILKKILLFISCCYLVVLSLLSRQQLRTWENTETLWSNVIKKHPHLELPRRSRGKYYYMQSSRAKSSAEKRNFEAKAMADFHEAIKQETKSTDVYEGTGIIYESRGDLKNALLFLDKAISLDPKKGRAYFNRAMVYDGLNQKELAISDYTSALAYKPDLTLEILSNRSVLYIEMGKFREAIGDLDKLIVINPKEYMYYNNRAFAKLQLNDIKGAIADYQAVIQLNPGDKIIRNQLQLLIDSQGR